MQLSEIRMRDPFVLNEGGRLILYGSTPMGWHQNRRNRFVAYISEDMREWTGPTTVFLPQTEFWGTRDYWAPEVHAYHDAFYLFASFIGNEGKRSTSVLRAESPLGPFKSHGAQRITPPDQQCLDGTLYIEKNKPYMVFCHEWVECGDGEMCVIAMKDDLSGPDGKPRLLFHASDASWCMPLDAQKFHLPPKTRAFVTDGPFLFTGRDGGLKMLWSSFSNGGYSVGLAWSDGGVYGPWHQETEPVYKRDGGHCMLFSDLQGQLRMSLHTPNHPPMERPIFLTAELTTHGIQIVQNPKGCK